MLSKCKFAKEKKENILPKTYARFNAKQWYRCARYDSAKEKEKKEKSGM